MYFFTPTHSQESGHALHFLFIASLSAAENAAA
jgi:hypothetical protein